MQWYDHNGKRQTKCTRTTDKATAERIAAKFDADAALRRDGVVDVAQERFALEGRRPIAEHVADFRAARAAKGNTAKHVEMTDARVKRVITTSGAAHVPDLTPSTVQQVIKGIHDAGGSLETANSYLRAIKSFSRWLWRDRRTVDDPLVTLAGYNASTEDSRHARREVTPDELTYLLAFVERHTLAAHKLAGPDRAVLCCVALGTGLRVNELRSLTPASFSLDSNPPTVTVEAAYSKRRRRDVQPIRRDLADRLGRWLAERAGDERVFRSMPRCMARTLRTDLDAARAAWIAEAETAEERKYRTESQFLRYEDEDGRFADFHALRHTYVSQVVASGASAKTAQTLARHSTAELTIGRYSHARVFDLQGAVEGLPGLSLARPQQAEQATGTDGQRAGDRWEHLRGQSSGLAWQAAAKDVAGHEDCSSPVVDSSVAPQPIVLSVLGDKKATPGETWLPAEGTGLEPATPYGAPQFQADADCADSRGKQQDSRAVGANAGAVELNTQNIDDDLQLVMEAWSRLPDAVRTAIRVIIQHV